MCAGDQNIAIILHLGGCLLSVKAAICNDIVCIHKICQHSKWKGKLSMWTIHYNSFLLNIIITTPLLEKENPMNVQCDPAYSILCT